MNVEVQFAIEYDFRWVYCFGHATLEGEHVRLEHDGIYHFYDHDGGEGDQMGLCCSCRKLGPSRGVVLLNLWDVFVSICDTKMGV